MHLLLAVLLALSALPVAAAPADPLATLRPEHPRLILADDAPALIALTEWK